MSPRSDRQRAVIKQAIEWRQRLGQGELDCASRHQFSVWMRSPAHAEELARICLIDALLQDAPRKQEVPPALPENVISFQQYAPTPRPAVPHPPVPATSGFTRKAAMAASTLLVVTAALVSMLAKDQAMVTRQGRWDKQLLEDGTVVYAGPNTRLLFDFDAERRAVTLVRGEASFNVAKQPGRPFIVSTDAGSVQALGTAFATSDIGDEVVVTVASGKVAVTSVATGQAILPLSANHQVVLSPIGASEPVALNAERELKWIRDWYEYHGEQVSEIIGQLNRRGGVQVIMEDPAVGRVRMSSLAFKPSHPEKFVAEVNRWYADHPGEAGDPATRRNAAALRLQQQP